MRPRVNTEKHIVQFSLFAIASGAITNLVLAAAAAVPTTATQVREGAIISAIYIEMWITSDDDASAGSSIVTMEKLPNGLVAMTAAQSASLNTYTNKSNILYTQMGLTPNKLTYPMATIKGWFKIPKGKQRMALTDGILLNIHGQSNGLAACGFCIYKEQF